MFEKLLEILNKINVLYALHIRGKKADRYLAEDYRAAKHSSFVSLMKRRIIIAVTLLIALLIIWPLTDIGSSSYKLNFDGSGAETIQNAHEKPEMQNPKFHGIDKNNRPFNITALKGISLADNKILLDNINGDITLKDGSWISILSEQGNYNVETQELFLNGKVNLFMDNSYEFFTESANINLEENMATGVEKVRIQGKIGVLDANGFIIKNSGDEVLFLGGVKLVGSPKAAEEK
jgi:lipopolysaccharide export system protein LptC